MNVETKVEAGAPNETAPREEFVQKVAQEVRKAGMVNRVTIESPDWGSLMRWHQIYPRLPIFALTKGDQFFSLVSLAHQHGWAESTSMTSEAILSLQPTRSVQVLFPQYMVILRTAR
ncbi:hypothetical protein ACN6MY_11580 [Peribacillus sp. B-H-3]|uniref:hypothetical protein n=1 Tax=Peribacillus sp. B-H-3 TaxID=3400420 RepID=UPI003B01C667